ncbi:glycosyltransferase [uncultured Brevundimonas sp.]|uniref:glycosyltransferase n=1 Tax=uncultured Brevundimonas sp. TaxID=213418 RepID=UPI0025D3A0CE|nr:glycosyltransferase [uncultured Brevundimonas sp.]
MIAVAVQGLFEKSDSIGYDAVFEYKRLIELAGPDNVKLFAEKFDQERYPDIKINSISELMNSDLADAATVVYHYCDGWAEFDEFLANRAGRTIVRWHNNTPPWFYAPNNIRLAERCVAGFEAIINLLRVPNIEFWVNSKFTARQLEALGGVAASSAIVFPASRYLDAKPERRAPRMSDGKIRLLFVGRVVAHKGHAHIIDLASFIKNNLKREVCVDFAGRQDSSSSIFNTSLKSLCDRSGVDVRFHGEVDEDQLRSLYRNADAFVCFSEHEGFGLPVFEAMRCGLPVVAWSRTALGELLQGHPLCFDQFDRSSFAAAIEALDSPDVVEQVVELQEKLATAYSLEHVSAQIRAALRGGDAPVFRGVTASYSTASLRANIQRRAATFVDSSVGDVAIEYGENFVTRHDLEAYRSMLALQNAQPSGAIAVGGEELLHSRFSTIGGEPNDRGIIIPAGDVERHVVFGPYMSVRRGQYRVTFNFAALDLGPLVRLDVLSNGAKILAQKEVKLAKNKAQPYIDFNVFSEVEVLEFRVRIVTAGSAETLFQGATLEERAAMRFNRRKFMLRRIASLRSRLPFVASASRRAFREGDAYRDRGNLESAIAAYRRGLKLAPGSFAHIVQLGNCLKDSGNPIEAEETYRRALSLRPMDADAHLQLARLYRKTGKVELEKEELLAALICSPAALDSLNILASETVEIGDAVKLALMRRTLR